MQSIPFNSIYAQLPERFYQTLTATDFPEVKLLKWNDELGSELNLDRTAFNDQELADIFSGKKLLPGEKPLAQAYSGHQFGHFNPHLGDGRALLLGELKDRFEKFRDIHLKGSGPTQFSRRGDGKANLAAVIREYLVSEAMHALKIPTSRTLAIISTGDVVRRETEQPGAILVRVAASHVRVGTFEHFLARQDYPALKILADFVIDRHHPDLPKNREGYLQLFSRIVENQAKLVSSWMSVGFIHGVMNTDNTFVSGETLDYGPCAFMEEFNPLAVFSSIDHSGRYAYIRQPEIMQWNLSCLGQCFLEFIDGDKEELKTDIVSRIEKFSKIFFEIHLSATGKKFGLHSVNQDDTNLMQDFLKLLHTEKLDYTNSFRRLTQQVENITSDEILATPDMTHWLFRWRERLAVQNKSIESTKGLMNSVNPAFIPRNHRVEEAIRYAVDKNDFSKFELLNQVLKEPFKDQPEFSEYTHPAKGDQVVQATFCNT